MYDIQKLLGNAAIVNGRLRSPSENEPVQYGSRNRPYLNTASTRFHEEYARYASNYMTCEVQGLDLDDPKRWIKTTIRMAELVKTSAAMQRQFDNHKMVLFDRQKYAYIPRGTKLKTMGSVWLCTNPENISGGDGIGVFQRCNTTWNHFDFYGNILKEPIVFETEIARANAPDPQYNMPVVKGYFNIKAQYNEETAQIDDNTRFIFGKACYVATGVSDFEQEFTGDENSVRFMNFTIRRDEVNDTIDDRVNRVAGGKLFSWEISIVNPGVVPMGSTVTLTATSKRNGEAIEGTEAQPISYIWSSSDESIATVDENGVVTPVSEGTCEITATLAQNKSISETIDVSVADTQSELVFESAPPEELSAYEETTIAVVPPTGSTEAVMWSFSGASPKAYAAVVNGNSVKISCWGGSIQPLVVTARSGEKSVSATIKLAGI